MGINKRECCRQYFIANFKTKFIDSLVGADSFGNSVLDNTLNIAEQYGIQFRPKTKFICKTF